MGELHMEYKRTIQFRYFRVLCEEKDANNKWGHSKTFDLVKWITKMDTNGKLQQSIRFGNTVARIECFKYCEEDDLWGIHLMKLRDTNIPTKVKENEASEPIELEADEYLGEDLALPYDKGSSILMAQMNRFSLGIGKMEEFINYTFDAENTKISIKAIIEADRLGKLKNKTYKSIEVSFANLANWKDNGGCRALGSIMTPMRMTGGLAGAVKITLGHSRSTSLNKNESMEMVEDILANKDFIRSAKVKVSDDDEKGAEVIDLFEEVYHDYIQFTLQSKKALEFGNAFAAMRYYFKKHRDVLYNAISYNN